MAGWFRSIINSKSKTFLTFCFCFIAASSLSSLFIFPIDSAFYLYLSSFVFVAALIIFWNNKSIRFYIFCFLFIVLGLWRYALTIPNCKSPTELCYYNNRSIDFVGFIADEPQQKIDGASYVVAVHEVGGKAVVGKVLLKNRLYPSYSYGDRLAVSCKILPPRNQADSVFHYDKYLARFGVWSICSYPKIERISGRAGNQAMSAILTFKQFLNSRVSELWAEPEGTLLSGVLYGARSGLPAYLIDDFSRTGVSHIVAVSGFNITIIIIVIMDLLVYLGLVRQRAFYVIVFLTLLFVIFTGFTASAVRAGFMGIMVLTARQVGRGAKNFNVIIFTVALMQLLNPYLLIWDVGFQLSFLALIGLIYISPVLTVILSKAKPAWLKGRDLLRFGRKRDSSALPQNEKVWINMIGETFIQTLSAIIATLPLMLYQFGTLSLVAPLSNILILWIVPWLMLLGMIAIIGSLIFFPLGQLFAFITHFGLSYVIMVVQFLGGYTWSSTGIPIPLWLMFVMYGIIILWLYIRDID